MKLRFVLGWIILAAVVIQLGCDAPLESEEGGGGGPDGPITTIIRGSVIRKDNGAPLAGAAVYDINSFTARDTTLNDGAFELVYNLESVYSTRIAVRLEDFDPDTANVTLSPGRDTTFAFRLEESLFQVPVPPSVREPAQIAFIGATSTDIFVSGVGALETAVLTYEVRDSLGFPIDQNKRAFAQYSLEFFPNNFVQPGTEPRLIPANDSTDNVGRLRVSLSSGTTSGVVQVVVTIVTPGGDIKSQPVRVSVNSGFADQRHFTFSADNYNFPGLDGVARPLPSTGFRRRVYAHVSDKYSNPVLPGTAVYFNTQHGTVTTRDNPGIGNVSLTDIQGFAFQELLAGNPYPEGTDAHPTLGPGYSYVYAQTIGQNGTDIIDSVLVLWTGRPIITKTGGPATFAIPNGGSAGPFTFTVLDRLGHPMSAGTVIGIDAAGVSFGGDVPTTLFDTFSTGPGITDFTVSIFDADPADVDPPLTGVVLTVTITHPDYGLAKLVLATGSVD